MARTKQIQTTEITGHTYQRIQLIDSLLFKRGHLPERRELLEMVNRRLEEPISIRTLDEDIRKIRLLLAKKGCRVRLVQKADSYYYSERGFSLFGCPVSEDDAWLLELGSPLYRQFFGEETALRFLDLCKRVMGMIPGAKADSFKALPFDSIVPETAVTDRESQWLPRILTAIRDRQTLRVSLKGNDGMSDHLSPYRLVPGRHGFELVAHRCDPTGVTEGRIERFPLSDFKAVADSNRHYREEGSFASERHVEAVVHRLRNRSKEEEGFEGMDDHGIRA